MAHAATTTELFLVAMAIIFLLPYLARPRSCWLSRSPAWRSAG